MLHRTKAELRRHGFPVNVVEADIRDRSKADAVTKIFAISQSGWLIVQSIARGAAGLSISELELMTMAFVFCALITYLLWWDKPFDAERAQVLEYPGTDRARLLSFIDPYPAGSLRPEPYYDVRCDDRTRIGDLSLQLVVEQLGLEYPNAYLPPTIAVYLTGTIFSAIHLAAWNWDFPSPLIQTLWRYFGLLALAMCLLPMLVMPLASHAANTRWEIRLTLLVFCMCLQSLVYAVSRVALIVLTFYCFKSMPAAVYEPLDWTRFIPHYS